MPKWKPVIQTTKQVLKTAEQLEELATNLRVIADRIGAAGFEQLDEVGTTTELAKALTGLDSYWIALQRAFTEQKKKRGDFYGVRSSEETTTK